MYYQYRNNKSKDKKKEIEALDQQLAEQIKTQQFHEQRQKSLEENLQQKK